MKQKLILFLVMSIACTSLLMGCQSSDKSSLDKENNKNSERIATAPVGTYPIVEEKITLTVAGQTTPGEVDNFEENKFTQWLEEKTNVHIDWITAPRNDYRKKLNLLMASGEYPDIILRSNFSLAEQALYYEQGVLLPLNDLIEEYGPNTKKTFEEFPLVKNKFTLGDGSIVSLPRIDETYHTTMPQKMWIYTPWLDELGLDMPATTEEFYNVLKAFKEQDPNKNNKTDEIPLAGEVSIRDTRIYPFLMNAFVYTPYDGKDANLMVTLNNGKVDIPFNKEEWKEGLKYIHKLYQEGLIASESFVQDKQQLTRMGENPDDVILGAVPARFPTAFTYYNEESGRWKDYKTVPALEGPDGVRQTRIDAYIGEAAFNITNKCEYPEVAMRWADLFYDKEVTLRSIYGDLGTDWAWAEEGDIGTNGEKAIWKQLRNDIPINTHWAQGSHSVRSSEFCLGKAVTDHENNLDYILYNETKQKYDPYKADIEKVVPPLIFTKEESNELVDLQSSINQFFDEMTVKFITGNVEIDKYWDKYVDELNAMGLERYLEIYQQAYERKYQQ